jgi:hypothetical protein
MRRRLEAIIPRIYGLFFGLSLLFFTWFVSGGSPKRRVIVIAPSPAHLPWSPCRSAPAPRLF